MKKKELLELLSSVSDDQDIKIYITHTVETDGFGKTVTFEPSVHIESVNPYCYEPMLNCHLKTVIQDSICTDGAIDVFEVDTDDNSIEELFNISELTDKEPNISDVFDNLMKSEQIDFIEDNIEYASDECLLKEVEYRDLLNDEQFYSERERELEAILSKETASIR